MDTVAWAANELAPASACLAEAYEQRDADSGAGLEEHCFRPAQIAYGRAKRAHTEFAAGGSGGSRAVPGANGRGGQARSPRAP